MADRILGPAYPALLTFGAPVVVRSAVGGMYPAVYITADAGGPLVCTTLGLRYVMSDEAIEVDYADPHTRDRVARALADADPPYEYIRAGTAPYWYGVCCSLGERVDAWSRALGPNRQAFDDPTSPALMLRAVADAVWGGR